MASKKNKVFRWIFILMFGILLLLIAGLLVYGLFLKDNTPPEVSYAEPDREEDQIIWNGEAYVLNDHLSNYLFIGVDEYEMTQSETGKLQAGSSDALYLLSFDRMTGDMTMISIPRDTITDIEIFAQDGSSAGFSKNHISLSYSFGDGKHKSCQLTKDAVSNLFYGLNITGYCAMSMSGLAVIPQSIGSFEVVVPNDSLDEVEDGYGNGQTVLITPENSEFFVRTRDINAPHSAIARQERQIAYLEAAFAKVEEQYEKDPGMAADLYEDLSEHLVTNMGTEVFADLMDGLYSGGQISTVSLPGESVVGEQYDEFHVNDDQLYQLVIETFYKKVEK